MKVTREIVDQSTSLLPLLKGDGIVGLVRSVDVLNEIARVEGPGGDGFPRLEEEVRRR